MRIIKVQFLVEAAKQFPKARKWIGNWCTITKAIRWKNLQELRKTYPSADAVTVKSGRTVTLFNVCGNDYRLIVAIHYNRSIVYTLRFLTHANTARITGRPNYENQASLQESA